MRDMHAAGKPVDPVTIAWEAARRGIAAGAEELAGGTAAFVVADAREVYRHGLLARITRAGHEVGSAAGNSHVQVASLLREAGRASRRCSPNPARKRDRGLLSGCPGKPRRKYSAQCDRARRRRADREAIRMT